MKLPRFRVRTLMLVVALVALLTWGAMIGARSYDYQRRARDYEREERGWRDTARREPGWRDFGGRCVRYFAELSRKYRRAAWHPWEAVAPDPLAPGHPGSEW